MEIQLVTGVRKGKMNIMDTADIVGQTLSVTMEEEFNC